MRKTVLVLGGNGFIGRHIVQELRGAGHKVRIGTRNVAAPPNIVSLSFHKHICQAQLERKLEGVDVVINAVGILRQRWGETYDQVHHVFVKQLLQACTNKTIRYVHISALGLQNPVKSHFLISKRDGESAIKASGCDWRIVRPSIIDGDGGYGAKWFRMVAAWPFHVAPKSANGKLAPIHVHDVARAVKCIALADGLTLGKREFELGGPTKLTVIDYLTLLRGRTPWKRFIIPATMARAISHLCDVFHFSPFSFGHFELLQYDNVPTSDDFSFLVGKVRVPIGRANATYVRD